jgi:hypothetical protein
MGDHLEQFRVGAELPLPVHAVTPHALPSYHSMPEGLLLFPLTSAQVVKCPEWTSLCLDRIPCSLHCFKKTIQFRPENFKIEASLTSHVILDQAAMDNDLNPLMQHSAITFVYWEHCMTW